MVNCLLSEIGLIESDECKWQITDEEDEELDTMFLLDSFEDKFYKINK